MAKHIIFFILSLVYLLIPAKTFAQCPAGYDSVTIKVETGINGYEAYWQLVTGTSACGTNVVFTGGNVSQINCNGANSNVASPGNGYANYSMYMEGPFCLQTDSLYSIQYIDDAGQSDNYFTVLINGFPIYRFHTLTNSETFSFTITPPFDYNMGLEKINTLNYSFHGNVNVTGTLFNYSANTIQSMDLSYSIDNGNTVTQNITGLTIAPFTSYDFVHPIAWVANNGEYTLKVWTSNLNGNADMDVTNDTLIKPIVVGDSIPNIIDQYLTSTVVFIQIGDSTDQLFNPSDLDFQTILSHNELWVLNMSDDFSYGSTVTFYNAGEPNQLSLWRQDDNSDHFMNRPSALAFSDNTNFATSAALLDAHHGSGHFAGPALWSSDSAIYAQHFPGLLGSHLDMLHQSPWSMGIASAHENIFWVYDGYNQRITYYDFVKDHGPGHDNHEDGIVRRYNDIVLNRINDTIPSHLVLDHNTGWLYVVDNGNARVVRMDIHTGSVTGTFTPYAEPLAENSIVTGTTWSNYISTGLVQPSGIDLIGDRLIVSDFSNGDIIIYDNTGASSVELGRIQTGSPGVAGIKIGPDGKIWYVNMLQNKVFRIDFVTAMNEEVGSHNNFQIYPNPANDLIEISFAPESGANTLEKEIKIYNTFGQIVFERNKITKDLKVDTQSFSNGLYIICLEEKGRVSSKRIIVTHKYY